MLKFITFLSVVLSSTDTDWFIFYSMIYFLFHTKLTFISSQKCGFIQSELYSYIATVISLTKLRWEICSLNHEQLLLKVWRDESFFPLHCTITFNPNQLIHMQITHSPWQFFLTTTHNNNFQKQSRKV